MNLFALDGSFPKAFSERSHRMIKRLGISRLKVDTEKHGIKKLSEEVCGAVTLSEESPES
jgi:hypothetical protein